eukprot:7305081-Prymnesium_polylepis.2
MHVGRRAAAWTCTWCRCEAPGPRPGLSPGAAGAGAPLAPLSCRGGRVRLCLSRRNFRVDRATAVVVR